MQTIFTSVAALAVAQIFYLWRSYQEMVLRKQRVLCERVAYMLWTMANGVPE
jgi:hypothetical protein